MRIHTQRRRLAVLPLVVGLLIGLFVGSPATPAAANGASTVMTLTGTAEFGATLTAAFKDGQDPVGDDFDLWFCPNTSYLPDDALGDNSPCVGPFIQDQLGRSTEFVLTEDMFEDTDICGLYFVVHDYPGGGHSNWIGPWVCAPRDPESMTLTGTPRFDQELTAAFKDGQDPLGVDLHLWFCPDRTLLPSALDGDTSGDCVGPFEQGLGDGVRSLDFTLTEDMFEDVDVCGLHLVVHDFEVGGGHSNWIGPWLCSGAETLDLTGTPAVDNKLTIGFKDDEEPVGDDIHVWFCLETDFYPDADLDADVNEEAGCVGPIIRDRNDQISIDLTFGFDAQWLNIIRVNPNVRTTLTRNQVCGLNIVAHDYAGGGHSNWVGPFNCTVAPAPAPAPAPTPATAPAPTPAPRLNVDSAAVGVGAQAFRPNRAFDLIGDRGGQNITLVTRTPEVCVVSGELVIFLRPGVCTVDVLANGTRIDTFTTTVTTEGARGEELPERNVFFAADSSVLSENAKARLRRLVPILRGAVFVTTTGHAADAGDPDDTFADSLSNQRAEVVAEFLRSLGIDATAKTHYGKSAPRALDNPAANRRVVVAWFIQR